MAYSGRVEEKINDVKKLLVYFFLLIGFVHFFAEKSEKTKVFLANKHSVTLLFQSGVLKLGYSSVNSRRNFYLDSCLCFFGYMSPFFNLKFLHCKVSMGTDLLSAGGNCRFGQNSIYSDCCFLPQINFYLTPQLKLRFMTNCFDCYSEKITKKGVKVRKLQEARFVIISLGVNVINLSTVIDGRSEPIFSWLSGFNVMCVREWAACGNVKRGSVELEKMDVIGCGFFFSYDWKPVQSFSLGITIDTSIERLFGKK